MKPTRKTSRKTAVQPTASVNSHRQKHMSAAAADFAKRWEGRGYERGESQPFWIDLLKSIL